MKWNPISRRHFLQGAGGFVLGLPLLPSLLTSKEAKAATGAQPRRLITLWQPNGRRADSWYPSNPMWANTLSTTQWVRDMPLSSFSSSQISPILGTSLNPFLSKLTLIRGLDHIVQLGHNSQAILGNFDNATPTIDQVLAMSPKIYAAEPSVRNLLLSDQATSTSMSWDFSGGNLVQLPAFYDPQAAFDRIFYSNSASKTAMHQNVLNLVYQDYVNLKSNPRLGSSDRAALDSHLSYLSTLQNRLSSMAPLTCAQSPTRPAAATWDTAANITAAYQALCDVIIAAIRCGSTKIASLRIGTGCSSNSVLWTAGNWHGESHTHEPDLAPDNVAVQQWICNYIFSYILRNLDVPEANGTTYLDNSLVIWGNEISTGWVHDGYDTQMIMAGGLGGYLKTGRFIDYSQWGDPTKLSPVPVPAGWECNVGRGYNQLLVTILQGMGLQPADYLKNGATTYGSATTPDPSHMTQYASNIAEIGNPLPFLLGP